MEFMFQFPTPILKLHPEVVVEIMVSGESNDDLMIEMVQLSHPNMQPVLLTETQFVTLFPDGQDIINNAFEEAASK